MTIKNTKGRLILKEIEFDQVYERTVMNNNSSSGKIYLPLKLIGKKVYVIVEPDKK